MPDVIMESKDFKVFLDFMDSKDATYTINYQNDNILMVCIAKNGRYIGERVNKSPDKIKYTCNKPLRITFDSQTKDILRNFCGSKDKKVVSIDGPRMTFANGDFRQEQIVSSDYIDDREWSIINVESLKWKLRLPWNEFYKSIKSLSVAEIDTVRLRFLPKSTMLDIFGSNGLSSCGFRVTAKIQQSGQLDAFYNTDDLWNMVVAMKRYYGRYTANFSMSVLDNGSLFFETHEYHRTVTKRAILSSIEAPSNGMKELWDWSSTTPSRQVL